MFKNRIRTAAIAGIAALATGVGAVVVPASAQDTVLDYAAPAGEYWVDQDASAAYNATPVNHTEEELKAATDRTTKFVVEDAQDEWRELHSELNFDPSEEQRASDIRHMQDLVIAEQEHNSATIKQIQESIAYAFQADQDAAAAWQELAERAHEISNELHALDKAPVAPNQTTGDFWEGGTYGDILFIPKAGPAVDGVFPVGDPKPLSAFAPSERWTIAETISYYNNETGAGAGLFTVPTALPAAPTDDQVATFIEELQAFMSEAESVYDRAGDFLLDRSESEFMNRYHAQLIVELYDEVVGYYDELNALEDASQDASREAQQSDVLVRQGFLMRAIAQRDLLRNWEGHLLAWARYIELYNDPTITYDRTLLSTEYREVTDQTWEGIVRNTPLLVDLDVAVNEAFWSWTDDLVTNADALEGRANIYDTEWDFALVEERMDASDKLLEDIKANGEIWREALNYAQALEHEVNGNNPDDKFLDRLEEILNGDDANNDDDDETPTPNPDDEGSISGGGSSIDAPSIDGGSSNLGGFGIAAVIAAIIGVLALVVPNIQNFL